MAAILDASHLAALQKARQSLADVKQICAKGAACGFDLSGHEAWAQALEQQIATIQQEFGPKKISEG